MIGRLLHTARGVVALAAALTLAACTEADPEARMGTELGSGALQGSGDAATDEGCALEALPYASEVVAFRPGEGAGFGADAMPGVVLGPPGGGSASSGSLDVVSLGDGGELVLGFGEREVVDGPGPDLIVFENAFYVGSTTSVFQELLEVAVSDDGETWFPFACSPDVDDPATWNGCAGHTPRAPYDACDWPVLDAAQTGGDAFDLADIGVARARFVRLRDVQGDGAPPSQGADIDAVGLIHYR